MPECLETIIRHVVQDIQLENRKQGNEKVQNDVRDAVSAAGYVVDQQDTGCFLKSRMPVWQQYSENGLAVKETVARRIINLVVYEPDKHTPVALIEVESELAHMSSKTNKFNPGCYAVASIARDATGKPFDSYNSVETNGRSNTISGDGTGQRPISKTRGRG